MQFKVWINNIIADRNEESLYAAGKDGHIKVWKIVGDRLQDVADLISHTKSVNGLARINYKSGEMFASGGDDKTLKIWRHYE